MNRRHLVSGIVISLFVVSLFSLTPFAAATSRKNLLEEFCVNNQLANGAYIDTPNGTRIEGTEFTTYVNIYILSLIDSELEMIDDDDLARTRNWFIDHYDDFVAQEDDDLLISDAYFAYSGLIAMNEPLNGSDIEDGIEVILEFQNETSLGFGSNSQRASVSATYHAIAFLTDTNNQTQIDTDLVGDYVMSCWDETAQMFAGSPNGIPNLGDTYYAIKTLAILDQLNKISAPDQEALVNKIASYYIDDELYHAHYGGYALSAGSAQSSILATFYATEILMDLEQDLNDATLDWVVDRQSPVDYGFQDVSPNPEKKIKSSAKLSFYAVNIILNYDSEAFSSRNSVMAQELWELDTSGWIIAAIVLGILAGLAAIGFGIYKYKTRI